MHRTKPLAAVLVAIVVLLSAAPIQAQPSARRALNTVLPSVELDNVAFSDAIDFLRDISGANIHVNWRALEEAGVGKDAQVNVRMRRVSLRKVLDLVLSDAGAGTALTYYIDQGVLEVTTRELADRQMFTRVYPILDLIVEIPDFVAPQFDLSQTNTQTSGRGGGGGTSSNSIFGNTGSQTDREDEQGTTRLERAQNLINVITDLIQPDVWQVNGGTAAIRYFNGSLIVTAPRSVHEALGGPIE